eukprot:10421843-Lingulodinium_polyedra.AAC.1
MVLDMFSLSQGVGVLVVPIDGDLQTRILPTSTMCSSNFTRITKVYTGNIRLINNVLYLQAIGVGKENVVVAQQIVIVVEV